ncbi:MAG: PEP-CTERM sorting domain-containing protein [Oscillatoriales cyanobacterium RM2_1_1]|nr:PEP-CTERM sorting domain-containing protein [Oscillatoriales cyanobacterium RM2_1_1]
MAKAALSVLQAEFPRLPEPTSAIAFGLLGMGLLSSQVCRGKQN